MEGGDSWENWKRLEQSDSKSLSTARWYPSRSPTSTRQDWSRIFDWRVAMSRELLMLVDALAREKNVEKDIVFAALELALASATKKRFKDDVDVRVDIDRETGEYKTCRRWQIVIDDEHELPAQQIALTDALEQKLDKQVGEFLEEPLEPVEFGRIGAQTAKQVILQKIRDAEREQILNDFLQREDFIVT